jgi:hypothetical protein
MQTIIVHWAAPAVVLALAVLWYRRFGKKQKGRPKFLPLIASVLLAAVAWRVPRYGFAMADGLLVLAAVWTLVLAVVYAQVGSTWLAARWISVLVFVLGGVWIKFYPNPAGHQQKVRQEAQPVAGLNLPSTPVFVKVRPAKAKPHAWVSPAHDPPPESRKDMAKAHSRAMIAQSDAAVRAEARKAHRRALTLAKARRKRQQLKVKRLARQRKRRLRDKRRRQRQAQLHNQAAVPVSNPAPSPPAPRAVSKPKVVVPASPPTPQPVRRSTPAPAPMPKSVRPLGSGGGSTKPLGSGGSPPKPLG